MKADAIVLKEGIAALKDKLGLIDSERFINLVLRDRFDYTAWQRNLWQDKAIADIHNEAEKYFLENN